LEINRRELGCVVELIFFPRIFYLKERKRENVEKREKKRENYWD